MTPSQHNAMNLLLIKGDWCDTNHLMAAGGNPASLINLVKRGIAEQREVTSAQGYPLQEFRISRGYFDENRVAP